MAFETYQDMGLFRCHGDGLGQKGAACVFSAAAARSCPKHKTLKVEGSRFIALSNNNIVRLVLGFCAPEDDR